MPPTYDDIDDVENLTIRSDEMTEDFAAIVAKALMIDAKRLHSAPKVLYWQVARKKEKPQLGDWGWLLHVWPDYPDVADMDTGGDPNNPVWCIFPNVDDPASTLATY